MIALALAAAISFDPLRFFDGRTEGRARLHVIFHHPHAVQVHGRGRISDGMLVLDQTVKEEGKPAETREWRIRRVGPGHYAGTLTDASGPVSGDSRGDQLHLAFPGKGRLRYEQRLVLAPDGRSAQNRLTVRKLGIVMARLDETISKVD